MQRLLAAYLTKEKEDEADRKKRRGGQCHPVSMSSSPLSLMHPS
jgi:hypothetical protein